MLVSSARHLPTCAKARPAPDALSPGRARFPTAIARSPWPTTAPRAEYSTPNPRIRVTMSGILKHADVMPIRFFIDLNQYRNGKRAGPLKYAYPVFCDIVRRDSIIPGRAGSEVVPVIPCDRHARNSMQARSCSSVYPEGAPAGMALTAERVNAAAACTSVLTAFGYGHAPPVARA